MSKSNFSLVRTEEQHFYNLYRAVYKTYRYRINDDMVAYYLTRVYDLVVDGCAYDNTKKWYEQLKKNLMVDYLTIEYAYDNLVLNYHKEYDKVHNTSTTRQQLKANNRDIFSGNKYLQMYKMLKYGV